MGIKNYINGYKKLEHFNLDDIIKYMGEISRVLKNGGILIESSSFPDTKEDVELICSKNKYHRHICTKKELNDISVGCEFKSIIIF